MNPFLAEQLEEVLAAAPPRRLAIAIETPLRAAATTLSRSTDDAVHATTVVGTVSPEDESLLEQLVADVAAEFDLDASLNVRVSSFSVRFERHA
jgi:hypothetical protein